MNINQHKPRESHLVWFEFSNSRENNHTMCNFESHKVKFSKNSQKIITRSDPGRSSCVIIKIITHDLFILCDYKNNHTTFRYFLKYCVIIFIITQDGVILCDYKILKNFRNLARKLYKAYTSTSLECWPLTYHILYINLPTDSFSR